MAITVKHSKVSTIPDEADTSVVRPSDWNADHTLVGVGTAASLDAGVPNGVATLDSSGQVPLSQIPALGDLNYQGTWNATTNSPTLTSSVGTKGFYYVVSVAGTTTLNGISDWQIGDWAVFNGSIWQKIDNTDAVTSVNGYTGTVVLTAADVGAVPYTGATTAVDLNAKSLVNVSNLGVNTTTVPTIKIRAVGDNNSGSRIAMRGYSSDANSSSIRVTKFRGTVAAPQAPQSGDSLGKFELAGYGTTSSEGYPQASVEGVATEAWGATARGTKALVKVTPNTTTTQVTALTIDQDSKATFASTVTANGTLLTGNTGTVTSVAATAGTGISVSGSPITTSGTLTITNTAPDQTVALTAGTGISTSGTYPNFTITNTAPSSGGTVTSVTGTAPVVSSGGNTPAISMAAATGSVNGYLTSTDWNTFNGKQPAGTYVNSVSATSPVTSSGGTTPTIAMPAATTSVSGYLTSTDWNTFNSKGSGTVTSVTGTAPVVSSGGATPAISMAAATTSVNGYLTSTDWTTFNNKGSGTVTSVAALTLGTTGTDLSSTVATGTTTPVITLQVPTASATNRGALSSADWSTFNGKANAFTYTSNYIPYGQGTTTPTQSSALQFNGTTLTTTNDASISGLTAGKGAGSVASNTVFGASAFGSNVSGANNVAVGQQALRVNTASNNTAVGYQAGYSNATGTENFFAGYKAGFVTTSNYNTIIGSQAGLSNTTGVIAAVGQAVLGLNSTGTYNVGVGGYGGIVQTLGSNTTGDNNNAFGMSALGKNTTGSNNTAVGHQANYTNTTGNANTAIGTGALISSTTVSNNTAVGYQAGYYITTGAKNTIIGAYNGNQGGLDIRTASNYVVLADGDGNPRQYFNGSIAIFNGTISPVQATTAAAPAYVKGAIYFDTTLNKLRVGGATAWETITSV